MNLKPIIPGKRIIHPEILVENADGESSHIYSVPDTGRILFRYKIDTILGIKHPGIFLGKDKWGIDWIAHNHYKIGKPKIVTLEDFAQDNPTYRDMQKVNYKAVEIIERVTDHIKAGKQYEWDTYNCQHFVNEITRNQSYSEGVDQASNLGLTISGALTLIGISSKNTDLLAIGTFGFAVSAFVKFRNSTA